MSRRDPLSRDAHREGAGQSVAVDEQVRLVDTDGFGRVGAGAEPTGRSLSNGWCRGYLTEFHGP